MIQLSQDDVEPLDIDEDDPDKDLLKFAYKLRCSTRSNDECVNGFRDGAVTYLFPNTFPHEKHRIGNIFTSFTFLLALINE